MESLSLSERSRCYLFFRQRSAIASPLVNSVSLRARILLLFINPVALGRGLAAFNPSAARGAAP